MLQQARCDVNAEAGRGPCGSRPARVRPGCVQSPTNDGEELENLRNALRPSLWRRVKKVIGLEAFTVSPG